MDYGLGAYSSIPIKTYEFDLKSNLAYGGSEGIYLDLWIEYFEDDKKCTSSIGTFKTLHESGEAMHTMAALLVDFILEENAYVNANLDDFTWEGVDVYPLDASQTCFMEYMMESSVVHKKFTNYLKKLLTDSNYRII